MSFTALAMPCTQEQFEKDLEPTLKRWGVKTNISSTWDFNNYIVNNFNDKKCVIGNNNESCTKDYNRTIIPYNPAKFLDSLFPEKWCVRDTKESTDYLRKLCEKNGWSVNGYLVDDNIYYNHYVYFIKNGVTEWGDSIPTDYPEVTLEELVYHYEQPKEEVMKNKTEFENKTRCGLDVVIFETSDKIYGKVLEHNIWTAKDWDLKGSYEYGRFQSRYDLIPFNPRIAKLKARKAELEAELEGINKELNK